MHLIWFDLILHGPAKDGSASLPQAAVWSMINVARELQHNKHCNQIIIAILAIILIFGFSFIGQVLTMLTFSVFLFYIHRPFFLAPAWDRQTPLSLPSSSLLLDRKSMHWGLMTANDAIVSCDGPARPIHRVYPPQRRNAIVFVIDTGTIFKKLEVQSTYYIPINSVIWRKCLSTILTS